MIYTPKIQKAIGFAEEAHRGRRQEMFNIVD